MSILVILDNISKDPSLTDIYKKILPLKDFVHPTLYSNKYFQDGAQHKYNRSDTIEFIDDLYEYLLRKLGYNIVISNIPETSKLKEDENIEDIITPEHIFDSVMEFDNTVNLVSAITPSTYAVVCNDGENLAELLDGKIVTSHETLITLFQPGFYKTKTYFSFPNHQKPRKKNRQIFF
jgi:hypothetical protein